MDVHNIVEDLVKRFLNDILNEKKDICKCEQCRLDMACYILNKTKPMYVVSSRGIIHSENNKRESNQADIDILSLVKEAVDVISRTPRHTDDSIEEQQLIQSSTPQDKHIFVFPAIVGRIIDSDTLNPISNATVFLYQSNSEIPVTMFNHRWENPIQLLPKMDGTFSFWPKPEKATNNGIQKSFQMNIEIKWNNNSSLRKFFEITSISSENSGEVNLSDRVYRLDDIYVSPED
ncbi:MAG: hypothetical protein A2015_08035 [Spirochaetes bacterium GWF1_31_7]|nr:MAG: hypothetical protein A2Y30_02125 [Spirochaetes bacterium GWE1_32_154]OHD46989.1 MAG: hypothetical protein A2015_08035 [Spirochaetes bacterium GWF1_31_7]OHD49769.1 MAG: hypothetical protein A2Y29_06235 [Spirochaetes bacterium GWE2_31_10]OHD77828.1 MAG: hypothetical protein A2355_09305 [Spirochaetes bacterium RIFOXYB1_FULL_32_8]HBD95501.1 hypothetical protein [Spirochaetia bacterium]